MSEKKYVKNIQEEGQAHVGLPKDSTEPDADTKMRHTHIG